MLQTIIKNIKKPTPKFEFRVKFWSLAKLQKSLRTTKVESERNCIKLEIVKKKNLNKKL